MYSLLKIDSSAAWSASLNYFIYDSIKIIFLLFLMITVMGYLRTYLSQEFIRKKLSQQRFGLGNAAASLFGAITPFCSCSSIPIFMSFLKSGVPLGVTLSFLITSPLVNEYLVVLMWGFFGWKITVIYVLSGILIGVFSGLILGSLGLERYLDKDMFTEKKKKEKKIGTQKERMLLGYEEAKDITKKMWIWVLVGVGIGAIIHNLVPEELIHVLISKTGFFGVPLATLIGIPMYANCAAIVPIALALFQKGVPLGTALSFMMATAALSLPEAIILRRAMKLELIAIFFGVVGIAIMITGFLLNWVQGMII